MIHLVFLAVPALLYFLPTIVASNRGHNVVGILLLNLFLGWTVIGWIVLMVWALLSEPPYRVYYPAGYYPPDYWRR